MAITLVQHKKNSAVSGSTASVSGMSAATSGNLLVAIVSAYKNPGQVTFTPPTGWTQAGTTTHDDLFISISTAVYYYENNPGGATSFSFTLSSSVSAWHIDVMEFSGVATSSSYDGYASREQHSTTPSSGAVTTTAAGDLLIGWTEEDDNNGAYTFTYPSGWTQFSTFPITDTNAWGHSFAAWKVGGSAGSENWSPTMSSSGPDGIYTLVAFKAASSGSSVQGAASLAAGAALTSAAVETYAAASSLLASATLSPAAVMRLVDAASLSGGLNLSPSGVLSVIGAAPLSGALNLSANAVLSLVVAASLAASLTLAADGTVTAGGGTAGAASLAASAILQAAGVVKYAGQSNLSASASLSAQAAMTLAAQIVLGAAAGLTASGARAITGQAGLSGAASLNVASALHLAAQTAIAAGLSLDVQAHLAIVGAAALSASLSLSATGQHQGQGIFENVTASILLLAALSASLATPTFPLTADIALLTVGPEGTVA